MVAFIHRDDVYTSREEWMKRNPGRDYPENLAEIIFAKHRNGPVRHRATVLPGKI